MGTFFFVAHQRNGNGQCCFGNIAHVCSLRSKPIQSYRVKQDDGGSHVSIEAHVLPGTQDDDGAEDSDASDVSADLDAANNDADGALDNTITDSENDEDPHNLDDQDLNTCGILDEAEVGGGERGCAWRTPTTTARSGSSPTPRPRTCAIALSTTRPRRSTSTTTSCLSLLN
jgi:hypothetical protein